MNNSVEELVLYCTRANLDDAVSNTFFEISDENFDWQKAIRYLRIHGLSLIFQHLINRGDFGSQIPNDILTSLPREHLEHTVRMLILETSLKNILRAFHKEGIHAIVLKGAYLDQKIYAVKNMRPYSDVDLLLKKEHFRKAKDILVEIGYEEDQPSEGFNFPWRKPYSVLEFSGKVRERPSLELHYCIPTKSEFFK